MKKHAVVQKEKSFYEEKCDKLEEELEREVQKR